MWYGPNKPVRCMVHTQYLVGILAVCVFVGPNCIVRLVLQIRVQRARLFSINRPVAAILCFRLGVKIKQKAGSSETIICRLKLKQTVEAWIINHITHLCVGVWICI